jgi:hypothetical protein
MTAARGNAHSVSSDGTSVALVAGPLAAGAAGTLDSAETSFARRWRPARWERSDGASLLDRYWAELLAAAIGLAVLVVLLHLYTRFPLPPGTDAGQWLTVSRYYLFEHVPADRSVVTVPPVVPVALAGLSVVTGTTGAIVALAAICYVAFCLVAFMLGRRFTGTATGGLLAVIAIAVVQSQLYEFFAMGAFPQLSALLGMALCLFALLALTKDPFRRREWMTLSGGLALTLFSHTPSSTLLLPVLAVSLAYVLWSAEDRGRVARSAVVWLVPLMAVWGLFLFVNRHEIFGYASVPAAFYLKGPDKLFDNVWRDNAQRMVFGLGLAITVALPLAADKARALRGRPEVLLAIWTWALVAIIALAAFRQAGTDYPRFAAYFIVPLGLAVAAGISALEPSRGVVVALVAPVLLFAGHDGLSHFDTATRFYGMNERSDDLAGVSTWLNGPAEEGGIIGGTRETKWLQALTGRDSLLYMPRIYITRDWEVERALKAEVVYRASGGIETGRMLITANDGGQDFGSVFPAGVRIDTFQRGIYAHAFTMRDNTTNLTLATFGASQKVSLGSMRSLGTQSYHDAAGDHLATTFLDEAHFLVVVRVITASSIDLDAVTVDYYVGSPEGVYPESLVVGTGDTGPIEVKPGAMTYFYPEFEDGSVIEVEARTSWLGGTQPPRDAHLVPAWRKATIQMDVGDGERRLPHTELYDPIRMLRQEGIRYIIDRSGDGASFPVIRSLGLQPVFENEEYRVYEVPGS